MRRRVLDKIKKKFLDVDDLLSFAVREGYWSELESLRAEIKKLGRRWPSIYQSLFYRKMV